MQKHIRILGGLAVVLASALTAQAVEQSSWGQVKQAVNEEGQVAGKAAVPGKGTVKPFELAVEALQDVNHVTDVTVTTKVVVGGFSAPTLAKHIQSKSFATNGDLRWTKNEMNVSLSPNGGVSTAKFQYSDMSRFQPVQVQEQVQNAQTGNTEVVNARGIVKLRPDIAIGDITVPEQVRVGQTFNIAAAVKELNGDLAATANVRLLNGDASVRDQADGITVQPSANVGVVFTTTFDQAGTYDLTVVARDVNPGDYDASNNSKSFTIVVIANSNVESVPFYLYYDHYSYNQDYTWRSSYGFGQDSYRYEYEYFQELLYLGSNSVSFPVDKITIQVSADNVPAFSAEFANIPETYSYDYGYFRYSYGSVVDAEGRYAYVQKYSDDGGYSQDYAWVQQYIYDYVYFGHYYYTYWGDQPPVEYSYNYGYGASHAAPINANSTIETRMVVEDDGRAFGGNASLALYYNSPWDSSWGYDDGDYSYQTHYWGTQAYGYSYGGMTQP